MGRQIKFPQVAPPGDGPPRGAERKRFARLGRPQPARRRFRIGVAHEENALPFVADHPGGQIVRGGILAHHAGRHDEDFAAAQFHGVGFPPLQHNQLQRLVQLQPRMLPMSPVALDIVNLGKHPAQAANINGLGLEPPFTH
jgi:hypothetical protein